MRKHKRSQKYNESALSMSFDHWLSDGRVVSSSYVLSKNVPETWETSCKNFCHIAHCSYFYLKTLFRNLCTCFHFLPVLSWTPLGTQRNTWFLLHFLGVKAKRYIHHECDILSGWPLPQGVYRGSWFMSPYNWDSPLTWNSVWQLNHASQFPAFSLL